MLTVDWRYLVDVVFAARTNFSNVERKHITFEWLKKSEIQLASKTSWSVLNHIIIQGTQSSSPMESISLNSFVLYADKSCHLRHWLWTFAPKWKFYHFLCFFFNRKDGHGIMNRGGHWKSKSLVLKNGRIPEECTSNEPIAGVDVVDSDQHWW